jgi:hypothetical protein
MMSRMFAAGVGGASWSEDQAMRLATNLLVGGLDTVADLMCFTAHFLANSPEHRRRLVTEPALIPSAVNEFTRRFGMTSPVRRVIADMNIDGITMLRGDMIVLPTMLQNPGVPRTRAGGLLPALHLPFYYGTWRPSQRRCWAGALADVHHAGGMARRHPLLHNRPRLAGSLAGWRVGTLTNLPLVRKAYSIAILAAIQAERKRE